MDLNIGYLKSPQGILKLVEIVFVIIAVSIFRGGNVNYYETIDAGYFICGVLITALIITPLLLVCYIMGATDIQRSILEMAVNFLLFLFLLTAGSVTINKYINYMSGTLKSKAMATGSFCILASFAYLGDFLLSVMNFRNE